MKRKAMELALCSSLFRCRRCPLPPLQQQHHVRPVSGSQPRTSISHRERVWWKQRMKKMLQDEDPPDTLTFAVDCSLNDHYNMNQKELKHIARQICFSYGSTIRCHKPCRLHLVGLQPGGDIEAALSEYFTGYDSDTLLLKKWFQPLCDVFNKKDLLYLSPYSSTVLSEVDSSKVYVLGGVVDATRVKKLTEFVAGQLDVPTACLPIRQFLNPLGGQTPGTLDLPLDLVVKILVSVSADGDWLKAFTRFFPKRKQWEPLHQS